MKDLLLLFIFITQQLLVHGQSSAKSSFINPTGTYSFNGKTVKKGGETYGKTGSIKVKLLRDSKIVMSLYVCRGALNYNSGAFIDTLDYKNNSAVHLTPGDDSTCKIIFTFEAKSVIVEQTQADPNFGCGFGHAVFADGTYRKISNKIPVISDSDEY